jgi:aspartate 1-decarboxylase
MQRLICKSKIHGIHVTEVNLHYEGSIKIDSEFLERADILPNEIVQVVNIANGERFETYVMEGEKGKGDCCLNGGAARLGEVGDKLIVISYGFLETENARSYLPRILRMDENNRILRENKKG